MSAPRAGLSSLDLRVLAARYASGALTPTALAEALLARDAAVADPAIWIVPPERDRLLARVAELEALSPAERARRPLYGVPFAVKDNIDVAGLPTTAACPAYASTPERDAPAVRRLLDAGALLVGKTNMDQFATGLTGVRSPYGTPRNPFARHVVPGGSSSGSAVAVARGLASFALGTDTAGSGRVPAGFCDLVGLKPSRGLVSGAGVVPACRSLDCVSVFALNAADARSVFDVLVGDDGGDPYGRPEAPRGLPGWPELRLGVPATPEFFGDAGYARLYAEALVRARGLGARLVPVDFAPFAAVARLLYDGPWVAERHAAVGAFVDDRPEAVHPVTRGIIAGGRAVTGAEAFAGLYRLEALRRRTAAVWRSVDALLVPTAPTCPTLAEVEADPIGPNARLGTYTNFVNLLDLAAVAAPAGFRADGLPFGITLIAPAMTDRDLLALAGSWGDRVELAVVGAHLEGQPLHHELGGAQLLRRTTTAPAYRLHALEGLAMPKPGLVRVAEGGALIEVEVYALDAAAFGRFVAGVPAPLAIGTVELADGAWTKGFVCEPAALSGAIDITAFGGWRAYRAASSRR